MPFSTVVTLLFLLHSMLQIRLGSAHKLVSAFVTQSVLTSVRGLFLELDLCKRRDPCSAKTSPHSDPFGANLHRALIFTVLFVTAVRFFCWIMCGSWALIMRGIMCADHVRNPRCKNEHGARCENELCKNECSVHLVRNPRFASFRTQSLENLSAPV